MGHLVELEEEKLKVLKSYSNKPWTPLLAKLVVLLYSWLILFFVNIYKEST